MCVLYVYVCNNNNVNSLLLWTLCSALIALTRRADVKEGEYVLITGAGGRLGLGKYF